MTTLLDMKNARTEVMSGPAVRTYSNPTDVARAGAEAFVTGDSLVGRGVSYMTAVENMYAAAEDAGFDARTLAKSLARQRREQEAATPGGATTAFVPSYDRDIAEEVYRQFREANPTAAEAFGTLPERARGVARGADQEFSELMSRASNYGVAAGVAGQIGAAVLSPESLAAVALGPLGVFGRVATGARGLRAVGQSARVAAVEGAAIEAAIQPAVQDWRGEAGLEHGFWEGVTNVAIVGGASAILGGTVRGVVETRRALRARIEGGETGTMTPEQVQSISDPARDIEAVAGTVRQRYENDPEFRAGLTAKERTAIEEALGRGTRRNNYVGKDAPPDVKRAADETVNRVTPAVDNGTPIRADDVEGAPAPNLPPTRVVDAARRVLETETDPELRKAVEEALASVPSPEDTARVVDAPEPNRPRLPRDLRGATPTYGYRDAQFRLEFESDIDRAAYIIAGRNKTSRRDNAYMEWLKTQGFSEDGAITHGRKVRGILKGMARDADDGVDSLTVREISRSPEARPRDAEDLDRANDLPDDARRMAETARASQARTKATSPAKQAEGNEAVLRQQEAVRRAVEEGTATPPPRDTLPRELRGAKPRYQQHPLEFESDVDKALYITAQKKKSRRDADYREYLRRQGLSDRDIDELGPQVRDAIRALAAEAGDDADALVVPTTRPVEPQPVLDELDELRAQERAIRECSSGR